MNTKQKVVGLLLAVTLAVLGFLYGPTVASNFGDAVAPVVSEVVAPVTSDVTASVSSDVTTSENN